MKKINIEIMVVILLMAVAVAYRLTDHWPNVTPVAAIALLAGSYFRMPWGMVVPVGVMLASDAIIGFATGPITVAVYGSFIVTAWLGRWLLKKKSPWRVVEASLLASTGFYLVTNAAVWAWSGMYPLTGEGLLMSYWYAIPFYRNTLLGDLAFTGSLFLAASAVPYLARSASHHFRFSASMTSETLTPVGPVSKQVPSSLKKT